MKMSQLGRAEDPTVLYIQFLTPLLVKQARTSVDHKTHWDSDSAWAE
jgi:hypothetical protein